MKRGTYPVESNSVNTMGMALSILTFVDTIEFRSGLGQELVDQYLIKGSKIIVAIWREGDLPELSYWVHPLLQDDFALG